MVVRHGDTDLMSWSLPEFLKVLETTRRVASAVTCTTRVSRCGLICDGTGVISLIPLHSLSVEWKPIIHDVDEFDLTFPGYVTLKNGPKFDDILDGISGRIRVLIYITESFNNHFEGNSRNLNLGELSRWRT